MTDNKNKYLGGFQGYISSNSFNITLFHNDDFIYSIPITATKKWKSEDLSKRNEIINNRPVDVLFEWKRIDKSIQQTDSEEYKTVSLKIHEIRKDYQYNKNNNRDRNSSK
ncbi:hypothetical protein BCR36DRAFT_365417 [Piromyces finnis]|uniref:Uncharacterized protein n=1 Tax=Piromyces finnis TaxID=1754191 RepID=A0A1Y1VN25_9FUNG|nr:hypothetical protein BCR36DRAFT_365417 [Piromyces finnis]|eukprot:ORX60828.1 hypothetical protein BCR36DRAFT_365417 [Piromyces finnis]